MKPCAKDAHATFVGSSKLQDVVFLDEPSFLAEEMHVLLQKDVEQVIEASPPMYSPC